VASLPTLFLDRRSSSGDELLTAFVYFLFEEKVPKRTFVIATRNPQMTLAWVKGDFICRMSVNRGVMCMSMKSQNLLRFANAHSRRLRGPQLLDSTPTVKEPKPTRRVNEHSLLLSPMIHLSRRSFTCMSQHEVLQLPIIATPPVGPGQECPPDLNLTLLRVEPVIAR